MLQVTWSVTLPTLKFYVRSAPAGLFGVQLFIIIPWVFLDTVCGTISNGRFFISTFFRTAQSWVNTLNIVGGGDSNLFQAIWLVKNLEQPIRLLKSSAEKFVLFCLSLKGCEWSSNCDTTRPLLLLMMSHSRPLFLYFHIFFDRKQEKSDMRNCRWLDSNCGPLALEESDLPAVPQTLLPFLLLFPYLQNSIPC